jgi:lipopolysaccharide exporter
MSGSGLAAAIGILTMPIVSRLFTPEDFGVAAMFVSITVLSVTFATLRYEIALVLPESETDALALLGFVYRLAAFFCLLLVTLVTLYQVSNLKIPALEILGNWIWLLPLGVFLIAAIGIHENWLTRNKAFRAASLALVTGNSLTSGSRIIIGAVSGSSAGGLIVGYLLGSASRLAFQMRSVQPYMRVFRPTSASQFITTGRRYSDFPRLNAPAGVIFALGANLPILLFAFLFSPEIVGFYAMAYRLAEVPLSIVSNAVTSPHFSTPF